MVFSTYKPDHIEDRLFVNDEFVPFITGKKLKIYD